MNPLYISECGLVLVEAITGPDKTGHALVKFIAISEDFDVGPRPWAVGVEKSEFNLTGDGAGIKFIPLHQHYVNQISESWNFEDIKSKCFNNLTFPNSHSDLDEPKGTVYLGSILHLCPSGKFYMPWSSNVTELEAEKDEIWREAMDEVFDAHNLYLESGEGDGLDVFACCALSWEEIAKHYGLNIENLDDEEIEALVRRNVNGY